MLGPFKNREQSCRALFCSFRILGSLRRMGDSGLFVAVATATTAFWSWGRCFFGLFAAAATRDSCPSPGIGAAPGVSSCCGESALQLPGSFFQRFRSVGVFWTKIVFPGFVFPFSRNWWGRAVGREEGEGILDPRRLFYHVLSFVLSAA